MAEALPGVQHMGWLSRPAFRQALSRARALLFPARWQEPFGIVGLEALSVGTPVIVMDGGGTGDWSGPGCIRVAAGDVAAMSQAIVRLSRDAEPELRLGKEGWRHAQQWWPPDPSVERVLRIYRR